MPVSRRLFLGLILAASALAQENLDATVERALKEFAVPGMAVMVVKDGKVLHTKGYGVRKLGDPAPVTRKTMFGIASNTKAFTAAALAMLVEEGKLKWDDPVLQYLPWFQMYDPYVTRELTVRDLLVHRSGLGLGAGDLMYFPPTDLGRDEILRRMRYVKPATSFRSRYAYDNALYIAAGQVVAAASGKNWDDFLKERIFKPLGMNSTNTTIRDFKPGDDIAMPHAKADGKLQSIEPGNCDNWGAAAAINSNLEDLSRWVLLQLGRGTSNGTKLFSEAQSREMWSPVTIMPTRPGNGPMAAVSPTFSTYALGWNVSDYRGRKLVHHTGGLPGMVTRVTLAPDLNLGVVVLTNQETGSAFNSVTYTVLDHYMGASGTDWVAVMSAAQKKREAEAEATVTKAASKRDTASKSPLPVASYAGRYRDAWYGDVLIEEKDGKLGIRFSHSPDLAGTLEHWQQDTFVARWHKRTLLADAYVTFSLKPDGSVDEVKMSAVSPATDFSFDFHDLLLKPVAKDAKPY